MSIETQASTAIRQGSVPALRGVASSSRRGFSPFAVRGWGVLSTILKGLGLAVFAFALFGPLANLALWSVAERWYTPFKLPVTYGMRYWEVVFRPTGDAMSSLATSVSIACLTVVVALAVSVPAGYALARLKLPFRTVLMIVFLLPQAFPSVAIYINVARVFYSLGLTGTIPGVVLVHAAHGLVYSVWIAAAAFAAVDKDLELAARNIGASPLRTFFTITLPLAAPGIMASAIFVFLESLDEFTGTFFVGVPQVTTLPLLLYNASMGGNYQIASITALILLVPSVLFMIFIERFLKADVLSKVGQ
ncbi:ABC transporter permease subunit [Microvirga brassicacearum]|uniref:ABC transporter permease subunit n=1 Tax=Microvirga brassicacearum TaxID=2580413 RepID=A0A5N3P4W4_9HYPH|nr:ABC transporter permease subunit [Microvirga brassicacearum]KAB0264743.1 ABC transporter permease subunit [Microvirga brassicacearum]